MAAVNAGFFDIYRGFCLGNLVSDGKIINAVNSANSNFGILKTGGLFFGYLTQAQVSSMNFQQLATGVVWLVRNGTVYVDQSNFGRIRETTE